MSTQFGVFGKIPTLGDFLKVGLPAAFVTRWDDWLQQQMSAVRETLGDGWNDAYLSAPIWRFTLPGGAAGPRPVSGVVLPSVDRVGRQYPLTLAVVHDAPQPAPAHFANTELFEKLENLAIETLDEKIDRTGLLEALEALTFAVPTEMMRSGSAFCFGPTTPKTALAGAYIAQSHAEAALWTTILEFDSRLMVSHGLPEGSQALGLFTLSAPMWPRRQTEAAQ